MNAPRMLCRFDSEAQLARLLLEQTREAYFLPQEGIRPTRMFLGGRPYLNLASNSYHGLGQHPEVIEAAIEAVREYGTSCGAAPVLTNTLLHVQFEQEIGDYFGMSAIVLGTGFNANAATIGHLVAPGESVFSDERNHASIWAGIKALPVGATCVRYRHCDVDSLRRRLKTNPAPAVVVTDSVFSMEGEKAPLPDIAGLCEEFGVALFLDEAHGFGVFGADAGLAAEVGVRPTFVSVPMSKSLASVGGVFLGPPTIVDTLRTRMTPYVFSANLPAASIAAALAALRILRREPRRIDRLHTVANQFRMKLEELGMITNKTGAIVSVFMGSADRAFAYARGLLKRGVFVNPVIAPGVPKGGDLLRCTVNSQHSDEEIAEAVQAFQAVSCELGIPGRRCVA